MALRLLQRELESLEEQKRADGALAAAAGAEAGGDGLPVSAVMDEAEMAATADIAAVQAAITERQEELDAEVAAAATSAAEASFHEWNDEEDGSGEEEEEEEEAEEAEEAGEVQPPLGQKHSGPPELPREDSPPPRAEPPPPPLDSTGQRLRAEAERQAEMERQAAVLRSQKEAKSARAEVKLQKVQKVRVAALREDFRKTNSLVLLEQGSVAVLRFPPWLFSVAVLRWR